MSVSRYGSFQEFWPFYVREHSDPRNRRLHGVGSALVLVLLVAALATGDWRLAAPTPVVGYGCAWFGHFFLQKNRPATFQYPLWSFVGDWKMFGLMVVGKMDAVVDQTQRKP